MLDKELHNNEMPLFMIWDWGLGYMLVTFDAHGLGASISYLFCGLLNAAFSIKSI
jgi:hypothetical protein